MKKIFALAFVLVLAGNLCGGEEFEGPAVWAHPQDLGKTPGEIEAFFELLEKSQVRLVFPMVKGTRGFIFWHSKKFPEAAHPEYKAFDLLEEAVRCARRHGIKIHPWLCDFTESKDSAAVKEHPEWVMVNPQGGTTADEKLSGDRPYGTVWMCPVRRPGYADQWLIPMMEEIIERYDVDGIHHDYVRYPGDVAPDSYCFCDYCLEHYQVYNHFYYPSRPQDRVLLKEILPRKEANWHYDLTLRPSNWEEMSRAEKAAYLLDGLSVGRHDLDYYFYQTRADAVTRFIRESTERIRKIKPGIEVSAAVFINPMRSARYIGQRWTDFVEWIDILAPMNYRSHFQGEFRDYLAYLTDYVKAQKEWTRGECRLYPGITGHYLYREERESWEKAIEILGSEDPKAREGDFRLAMADNIPYLERRAPGRAKRIDLMYSRYLQDRVSAEELRTELRKVLSDPPAGFFPREKFLRAVRAVKEAGAHGVSLFSAGILTRNKLWPVLEREFSR